MAVAAPPRRQAPPPAATAGIADALVLTLALALASFLGLLAVVLLLSHPQVQGLSAAARAAANQQNQTAKSLLYVVGFFALVPGAAIVGPRLADAIAARSGPEVLRGLALLLGCWVCLLLLAVKLSSGLPWADGVGTVLVVFGVGGALAAAVLWRAARVPVAPLSALAGRERWLAGALAALVFACVLSVTHVDRLAIVPVVLGVIGLVACLLAGDRLAELGSRLRVPRGAGRGLDVLVVVLLLLAVPDVVIYHTSHGPPNAFFPPGVYQFQQDWIIGPANNLLGGGALLAGQPISQYGVGMLYFLDGWFHIAPVGYGSFGLLDGILTALVYIGGYGALRMAGVRRPAAITALVIGLIVGVYALTLPVGALPEQGPLRFGVPMALIALRMAALRWPGSGRAWRGGALVVLGISAVWALEAFAYTALTFLAMVATEAWLRAPGDRRRWLGRQLVSGVAAVLAAHVLFALVTLAIAGRLPHWGDYLAYLHALLLGGKEGSITYGFDPWAPGLAVAIAAGASAAALIVVLRRRGADLAPHRALAVALAGTTIYQIAELSYTQNRASTYLVPYTVLPLVVAGTLWLTLAVRSGALGSRPARRIATALVVALITVFVGSVWSGIGTRFSESALAHLRPGGGLRGAVSRLVHNPVVDPRAVQGAALLRRYFPDKHVIVLLPTTMDLGVEVLMRAGRVNRLFIGDPIMDDFIPQVWVPKIQAGIDRLAPGTHILTELSALPVLRQMRAMAPFDPLRSGDERREPAEVGVAPELTWTLQQIDRRFRTRLVATNGIFAVLEIVARR